MTRAAKSVLATAKWLFVLFVLVQATPASALECWQGWGYLVDPNSAAYKSGQTLYVTDGAVNWGEQRWVRLYEIDPSTGRRVTAGKSIHIRPRQPVKKGSRNWAKIVEDVVDVRESEWAMLVRLTHVAPSPNARTLNDSFTRWACGLG